MDRYKKFEQFTYDLLLEYYNQNDTALYNHLKMNDRDKHIDAAFKLSSYLEKILNYVDIDEDISDEKDIEILNNFINGNSDLEEYEIIEMLTDETLNIIGKCILDNNYKLNLSDNMPSWFFFNDVKMIKKQWLVHCTNFSSEIYKKGFIKGTYEIDDLGLTTNVRNKSSYGYDFAYTVNDFEKYADRTDSSGVKFRYGNSLILFRSSGVRAYHNGDEEYQTIFWEEMQATF